MTTAPAPRLAAVLVVSLGLAATACRTSTKTSRTEISTSSTEVNTTKTSATVPCVDFAKGVAMLGANEVRITASPSLLEATCGPDGAETVLSFTAPAYGVYAFELREAAFEDYALYLVDEICDPIEELDCAKGGQLQRDLVEGQTVHVVIDAAPGQVGDATLQITRPCNP